MPGREPPFPPGEREATGGIKNKPWSLEHPLHRLELARRLRERKASARGAEGGATDPPFPHRVPERSVCR